MLARKSEKELALRSSAAEYLTFVAATGESDVSFEMRYEDENIWLTQKMMATSYDVSVAAINQHLKKVFEDGELREESVIKKYLITAADGKDTTPSTITCKPSLPSASRPIISVPCSSANGRVKS